MVELFANSGHPDQMPRSAASDLGLHFLTITLLGVSRLQWAKQLCYNQAKMYRLYRQMTIFFIQPSRFCSDTTFLGCTFKPYYKYIQNYVIMNHVIKRFLCNMCNKCN